MKYKSIMKKRAIMLSYVFIMAFLLSVLRIITIQTGSYTDVADMQFSRSLTLGESRGYIYDRNMIPLVNAEKMYKSVFVTDVISNRSIRQSVTDENKNGLLITTAESAIKQESDYIKNFYNIKRYESEQPCAHIIGYVNSDGIGVCGIEKAFDRILKDGSGTLKVTYGADASGKALAGKGIELVNNNYDSPAGISLTIDKNIQKIAENAIKESEISCGAVVVMDVNSFDVIAIASIPVFDPENVEKSLEDEGLPFLNRALNAYPAGSVFKPFIAAAAIENGWSVSSTFECKGYINIGNNTFRCFNSNIHGIEDINNAVENSCNTFFIDLGIKTGAEKIIEIAEKFGFGKDTQFCSSLVSSAGNIPESHSVTSDSQLANLCFGQGDILITPVQLAAAYSVLANSGTYKEPVILKELIDNEGKVYGYYKSETEYKAIDSLTCEIINTTLYNNMLNGTGVNGASDIVSSAGKTATAQTGRFNENGEEILCTWFAGFFPYEEPRYSVIVFNENGSTASVDCAPVFKSVVEGITKFQGVQAGF